MGSIGTPELILIFLAVLLIFGAKRIPEIARGLGKGIREFKTATREMKQEMNMDDNQQIQAPRPPAQNTMPRSDASYQQSAGNTESSGA
jgi:sec-independent protein translocase protein TatA